MIYRSPGTIGKPSKFQPPYGEDSRRLSATQPEMRKVELSLMQAKSRWASGPGIWIMGAERSDDHWLISAVG
jgi:hypothetical protein